MHANDALNFTNVVRRDYSKNTYNFSIETHNSKCAGLLNEIYSLNTEFFLGFILHHLAQGDIKLS